MSNTAYPDQHASGHHLSHIDSDDIKGEKYGGINIHTGGDGDAMVVDAEKRVSYTDEASQNEFDTEHTTTHRNLKPRHISMIAIGGAVGSGLIIGSGSALSKAGPVGLLIGYSLVGLICFTVMTALGEMATWLPDKRGFPGYATRFVDDALGFATGWNYLAKYLLISPNQIIASVVVITYWDPDRTVNVAVWCSIIIAVILAINILGVAFFGEIEFWMSTCKVLVLVGLLLLGIILDLGGGPNKDRIGFRYWKNPGPFAHYIYKNDVGVFLGVWYAIPNALFAYIGTELIGVTVGEARDPRKAIPRAIKSTFWRILVFYVGGIFVVGLLVPSNSTALAGANKSAANAAASPFVVAIRLAGIKFLPAFINGCILLFVFSAANSDVYIGSRTLFQLAVQGQAPKIFKRVDKRGIPIYALLTCVAFLALSYICVSNSALTIFRYFTSLISLYGALIWIVLLISHIRFRSAMKYQNYETSNLAYQAPFGRLGSIIALVSTIIIVVFKGYDAFMPKFQYKTFITNYIGIISFLGCYFGYKFYYKTRMVPLGEIDLLASQRFYATQDSPEIIEEPAVGFKAKAKRIFTRMIE
ncbi:amino acid transporter [Naganishia albida]|nr:amino acid transporter [Naganishia albida]